MIPYKLRRYSSYLYTFAIGFLLCLLAQFFFQDKFETNFFENVSKSILAKRNVPIEDSSVVDALHAANKLLSSRTAAFNNDSQFNYDIYSGSLSNDLLTAKGACGSYAAVLANLLKTMDYNTRIVQMKVKDVYGGHIITEVNTKKGWVVLDAMYDLFFVTPSGKMASFAEVSGNWPYYKQQTPEGYNQDYKYEDLRYANWEKIPILMPAMRKVLAMAIGERRTREVSIRPLFLRKYRIYCVLLIPCIIFLAIRLRNNYISAPLPGRKVFAAPYILPAPNILPAPKQVRETPSIRYHTMMNIISSLGLEAIFNYRRSHSRAKLSYYRSLIDEVNVQPILDCSDSKSPHAQEASKDISVYNIAFNSRLRKLRSKLGWPKYNIQSHQGGLLHDIYFYSIHLYNKNAVAQFHFLNGRYFLCNITFKDTEQKEKDNILDILSKKYTIQTGKNDRSVSIDTAGNYLFFENSVNLNICYVSRNTEIVRTLVHQPSPTANSEMSAHHLSNLRLQNIL